MINKSVWKIMFLFPGVLFSSITVTSQVFTQDKAVLRENYASQKESIKKERLEIKKRYSAGKTGDERGKVIEETKDYIFQILTNKIFPAWYGTAWSFDGRSRIPGKGSIACGTFVVYSLQDAGFKIPSKMAMQPSENIIKDLVGAPGIGRFWSGYEVEARGFTL